MTLPSTRTAKASFAKVNSLSDFTQLRTAVRQLQKDAEEQLNLEIESQSTFETFNRQLKALKTAFTTLSDVLMTEVDGTRRDTQRRCQELEAELARQQEMYKNSQTEISQLKRTIEVWELKERDWAKDNEILKASHMHNVEWMQQLQRDVMDARDQVHTIKQDHSSSVRELSEESCNLRMHWEKQVDLLSAKLKEYDATSDRQMNEIRAQAQQRLDDLELMEQALSTVQKQQMQLRSSVDEAVHALVSDINNVSGRIANTDNKLTSVLVSSEQLKNRHLQLERDQRRRHDNITKVFSVFADALNITPPLFQGVQVEDMHTM